MQQGIKIVVFKMPISGLFTTVRNICTASIQYLFFIHLLPIFYLCVFAVNILSSNKCITLQNKIEFHPILVKGGWWWHIRTYRSPLLAFHSKAGGSNCDIIAGLRMTHTREQAQPSLTTDRYLLNLGAYLPQFNK